MFHRHVFTCPDVVYLINRQKRINRISIGVSLISWGALMMYGNHVQKQIDKDSANIEYVPSH